MKLIFLSLIGALSDPPGRDAFAGSSLLRRDIYGGCAANGD